MKTVNNKNTKKVIYDFFADPGHGWLKVTRTELVRLKLIDKISSHSYQKNGNVFLEEDCDLSLFYRAKKSIDSIEIKTRYHHTNKESRIRNYPYFTYDIIDRSLNDLINQKIPGLMNSEFGKSHIIISTIGGN